METKGKTGWLRTGITNLVRNRRDGLYYARVKMDGRQRCVSLETSTFSVARLRLREAERELGALSPPRMPGRRNPGASVGRFIGAYLERTKLDPSLAPNSRLRREITVKAILKTWPDLPSRDARRVTPDDCQLWAARVADEGHTATMKYQY